MITKLGSKYDDRVSNGQRLSGVLRCKVKMVIFGGDSWSFPTLLVPVYYSVEKQCLISVFGMIVDGLI